MTKQLLELKKEHMPLPDVVRRFLRTPNMFIPVARRRIPNPLEDFNQPPNEHSHIVYPHLKLGIHLKRPLIKNPDGKGMIEDQRTPYKSWGATEFLSFYERNQNLIAHRFLHLYQAEMLTCSSEARQFLFFVHLHRAITRTPALLSNPRLGMIIIKAIFRHMCSSTPTTFTDEAFKPKAGIWNYGKRTSDILAGHRNRAGHTDDTLGEAFIPAPTELDLPAPSS